MLQHNQTERPRNRYWAALLPVLALAPLSMAAKGCDSAVIGDDCPDDKPCTAGAAGLGSGGSAGGIIVGTGGAAGGKPTGTGGSAGASPTGGTCGGLQGLTCASAEYCAFPLQAQCGAGDQTGTCQKKPSVCDDLFAPVCGCDGKTYANDCEAAAAGTSFAHEGACTGPVTGTQCGGLKGITCEKGQFCSFAIETMCGSGDQTGTCAAIPDACDASYDPVCGCDGKTYGNGCAANTAGVSVASAGACEGSGATCGGLLGKTCAKSQYCDFTLAEMCGAGDQTGTCTAIPQACPDNVDPVCGCDGKTYSNSCEAAAHGFAFLAKGACK